MITLQTKITMQTRTTKIIALNNTDLQIAIADYYKSQTGIDFDSSKLEFDNVVFDRDTKEISEVFCFVSIDG